jgi:TolB protein
MKLFKILLLTSVLLTPIFAEDIALTSFASGEGELTIGLLPFKTEGAHKITQNKPWVTIGADLEFSPRFNVIRVNTIDSAQFSDEGVALFISGDYKLMGDSCELELFLYDATTSEMILGKKFKFKTNLMRSISHHFSSLVYEQLFGEKGPYNSKILYTERSKNGKNIFLMDYDGHNSKKITPKGLNIMPSFIDKENFLWVSFLRGKPDIYKGNLKTGKKRAVIYSRKVESSPEYSEINGRIVYSSSKSGNMDIYSAKLDGSDKKRLTTSPGIDAAPCWSPNGYSVAFISDRSGSPQLYIMDREGGNLRRVSFRGRYHDAPSWSPDGKSIAFTSQRDGKFDIYTISIEGDEEQLVSGLVPGSNKYPSWSPDGSHIIFTSIKGGNSNLVSVSSDGKIAKQLTTNGISEMAAWSNF